MKSKIVKNLLKLDKRVHRDCLVTAKFILYFILFHIFLMFPSVGNINNISVTIFIFFSLTYYPYCYILFAYFPSYHAKEVITLQQWYVEFALVHDRTARNDLSF